MLKKWFTLVELIVVVTILAILATIGFVAYSGYLLEARDSNRIAALTSISDGFELHKAKAKLKLPDNNVSVKSDGKLIGWQWYIGSTVLESIGYSKGWVDPLDGQYYSYFLTSNKKNYQFLAFLEKKETLEIQDFDAKVVGKVKAENIDYYDRYPKLYGKGLWIMTNASKTPLQEVDEIVRLWYLDILTTTGSYIAYYNDEYKIEGDHTVLSTLSPYASCARMKDFLWKSVSGIYEINPSGVAGNWYNVYCEMQLWWGGWTLIATSADDWVNTWTFDNTFNSSRVERTDVANVLNKVTYGTIENYKQDYKSQAYGDIAFKDVMFTDKQWVWWAYDNIQPTREKTMDEFIPRIPVCAFQGDGRAYYMTSGSVAKNLWVNDEQQDRTLFFTVKDNEWGCTTGTDSNDQHSIWPTWGYRQNDWQTPDDPGLVGWGPSETSRSTPISGQRWHRPYEECRDARVGRKNGDSDEICGQNDWDYILWFVR